MELRIKSLCLLLIFISFSLCVFVVDVQAGYPVVQEVVVLSNGENTMLNVTFYHIPVTTFHYVDQVEVDVNGVVTSYPVSQSSPTFTAQINLGQISGNPLARTRVDCNVDGWSSWSSQQTIPELSLWITIPIFIIGILAVVVLKKNLLNESVAKLKPV